ncbi:MAG: hypothetical protein WCI55_09145 [Armatimonadota bacterium]
MLLLIWDTTMITSTLFLACAMAKGANSPVDYIFSTTCDTPNVYVQDSSYGQFGRLGSNPTSKVQPLGFSGKGNPSGFLNLTAKWAGTEPFEIFGCISSDFWTLTLSNNQVISVDFSADYRKTNPSRLPQLFLMQDDKIFMAEIPSTSTTVNKWIAATKSLLSNDFLQIRTDGASPGIHDSTSHPDFTTNGKSMYFMVGLDVFRTTSGPQGTEKLDYDNINIQVHTSPN